MMKLFCENSYRFKLHEDVGTTQCVYRDRFWHDSKHDFEKRNYLEKFGEKLEFFFFFDSLCSCPKAIFGPLARRQPPDVNHCAITNLTRRSPDLRNKVGSQSPVQRITGFCIENLPILRVKRYPTVLNIQMLHLLNLWNSPLVFPRTEYPPSSFLMENGNFWGLSSISTVSINCNVIVPFVSSNPIKPVK